jgi:hypothetical protein
MAAAHFLGIKVPLLFVYYDVPSNHYQDLIISFCVVGFAAFAYAASKNRSVVPPFLLAMSVVVLGLANINASAYLSSMMVGSSTTTPYWIQTGLIAVYVIWLITFYIKSTEES